MLGEPKYLQSTFSVVFPRVRTVRTLEHELFERLRFGYLPPDVNPVSDDDDPEDPRLIFSSEHGFSQVVVSQVSAFLTVHFSPDWQLDVELGRGYIAQRAQALFDMIELFGDIRPSFTGLVTRVHMSSDDPDETTPGNLFKLLVAHLNAVSPHDVLLKMTDVVEDIFFSNITIQNYRSWKVSLIRSGVPRLSRKNAVERGIEIVGDFNDRYAFNESKSYQTSRESIDRIVDGNLSSIREAIAAFKEG